MQTNTNEKLRFVEIKYNLEGDDYVTVVQGLIIREISNQFEVISTTGQFFLIPSQNILSMEQINIVEPIRTALIEIKTCKEECLLYEQELSEAKQKEKKAIDSIIDANLIANFNIWGTKNRFNALLGHDLSEFFKNNYNYEVRVGTTINKELEICIIVTLRYTPTNTKESVSIEDLIMKAPDELNTIINCFNTSKSDNKFELIKERILIDKRVRHSNENIYAISTTYKFSMGVDASNYMNRRACFLEAIELLSC